MPWACFTIRSTVLTSIMSMKKILDIDPENAEALNFIGYSYAVRDMHLDEAEAMILRALKNQTRQWLFTGQPGMGIFQKNDLKNAEKYLKKPGHCCLMRLKSLNTSGICMSAEQAQDAADMYERGMKIDPGNDVLKKKREDIRGTR